MIENSVSLHTSVNDYHPFSIYPNHLWIEEECSPSNGIHANALNSKSNTSNGPLIKTTDQPVIYFQPLPPNISFSLVFLRILNGYEDRVLRSTTTQGRRQALRGRRRIEGTLLLIPRKLNFQGQIELIIKEPVVITRLSLRIFGEAQTSWFDKRTQKKYKSTEFVLDEYMDLTSELFLHCNDALEFMAGSHRLEFKTKVGQLV
jgi:hypothetical protein